VAASPFVQGMSGGVRRYGTWLHINFSTERHDGSGNTVITSRNKGLNGAYKYVGDAAVQGQVVANLSLLGKNETILINASTKQPRILAGRLISDGYLKTLEKHLEPCSFDEGAEVRSWLRMGAGAKVFADEDGDMYGTGSISKYKGYTFLNNNASRPAAELVADFVSYWYLKRGGDTIVTENHVSVNDHL
jgi:hypothetical protein